MRFCHAPVFFADGNGDGIGDVEPLLATEQLAPLSEFGERLGALRLCDTAELTAMRRSLDHHGQLQALVVFEAAGQLEIIDGFKRLRAARALGWPELRTSVVKVDAVSAKAQLLEMHQKHGLTELEEGFVVRALHREDQLSQGEIAQLLAKHKSWVCRRLLLVERLDEAVQADVRMGLLVPRAAVALCALPRGNQAKAAEVVANRGLTVHQTGQLVTEWLAAQSPADQEACFARWSSGPPSGGGRRRVTAKPRSQADRIVTDAAVISRACARLQGRLLTRPLESFATQSRNTLRQILDELEPVLGALSRSIALSRDSQPIVSQKGSP